MLDDFEGFQYKRVQVKTFLDSGEIVQAWTYVMNEQIQDTHSQSKSLSENPPYEISLQPDENQTGF